VSGKYTSYMSKLERYKPSWIQHGLQNHAVRTKADLSSMGATMTLHGCALWLPAVLQNQKASAGLVANDHASKASLH